MAKIAILNGAARKNGNTAALIKSFSHGAEENGNEIREFYIQGMNIHGCLSCHKCGQNGNDCVQKDDMHKIYDGFKWADVIVFASPIYFTSITGILKTVNDRLFAMWRTLSQSQIKKKSVLLITANMPIYDAPLQWYKQFIDYSGWDNLGIVLGFGNAYGIGKANDPDSVAEAEELGKSIK